MQGVLRHGKGAHEELRGDLGNGWSFPQLMQLPNELQGEEAGSLCENLTGSVIHLSRGVLAEVVHVVSFCGETSEGGIKFLTRESEE